MATKPTKPRTVSAAMRAHLHKLAEFPADAWLTGGSAASDRLVDKLEKLGLVEFNRAEISLNYRLTAAARIEMGLAPPSPAPPAPRATGFGPCRGAGR